MKRLWIDWIELRTNPAAPSPGGLTGEPVLLDTTFLIDLQREFRTGKRTGALDFVKARPHLSFSISIVTVTEFSEGFQPGERRACRKALAPYTRVGVSFDIAWRAGQISRKLRRAGQGIGDYDILVAATALEQNLALVTRNRKHFERIEGLELLSY